VQPAWDATGRDAPRKEETDGGSRSGIPAGADPRAEGAQMRVGRILAGTLALVCAAALAQAQGVKRNVLRRADITGPQPKECVFGSAEFTPGSSTGRHFHHGFELGYLAEGQLELLVDGEEPKHLKAGDSYEVPAMRPHEGKDTGDSPAKVVATWVVEKGKPLTEPVK